MDNNTRVVAGGSQDDLGELESFGRLVLLILIVITFSSYMFVNVWAGNTSHRSAVAAAAIAEDDEGISCRRLGLDEATLVGYQKLLYSQHEGDSAISSSGCSICLAEYKDADILRLLPDCGHLFHVNCVDHWLRLRPTCPICRNSISSPIS